MGQISKNTVFAGDSESGEEQQNSLPWLLVAMTWWPSWQATLPKWPQSTRRTSTIPPERNAFYPHISPGLTTRLDRWLPVHRGWMRTMQSLCRYHRRHRYRVYKVEETKEHEDSGVFPDSSHVASKQPVCLFRSTHGILHHSCVPANEKGRRPRLDLTSIDTVATGAESRRSCQKALCGSMASHVICTARVLQSTRIRINTA
jgi:hypothetical protein